MRYQSKRIQMKMDTDENGYEQNGIRRMVYGWMAADLRIQIWRMDRYPNKRVQKHETQIRWIQVKWIRTDRIQIMDYRYWDTGGLPKRCPNLIVSDNTCQIKIGFEEKHTEKGETKKWSQMRKHDIEKPMSGSLMW